MIPSIPKSPSSKTAGATIHTTLLHTTASNETITQSTDPTDRFRSNLRLSVGPTTIMFQYVLIQLQPRKPQSCHSRQCPWSVSNTNPQSKSIQSPNTAARATIHTTRNCIKWNHNSIPGSLLQVPFKPSDYPQRLSNYPFCPIMS